MSVNEGHPGITSPSSFVRRQLSILARCYACNTPPLEITIHKCNGGQAGGIAGRGKNRCHRNRHFLCFLSGPFTGAVLCLDLLVLLVQYL